MFFKRKDKPVESKRERQRVSDGVGQLAAAPVFSYRAARSGTTADPRDRQIVQDKPVRSRRPKPLWLRPKNVFIAIAVISVFASSMSLSHNPKVIVMGDESSQLFLRDAAEYQSAARQLLAKSVTNGNKLTINTSSISRSLEAQFPEIRTVSISLPVAGRQPVVYLQPAVPQMILATQSGQFVLDSAGRALIAVSPKLKLPTGEKTLPLVTDESGLPARAGAVVLPQQSVAFIAEVAGQLRALHIPASSWRLPAHASELDVAIGGTSYYVRFNLQGAARAETGTYAATKQYLDARHIVPASYVDVRVSGRSYYH